jgi:hypothetical protein
LNRSVRVLQTRALPLGYGAIYLVVIKSFIYLLLYVPSITRVLLSQNKSFERENYQTTLSNREFRILRFAPNNPNTNNILLSQRANPLS